MTINFLETYDGWYYISNTITSLVESLWLRMILFFFFKNYNSILYYVNWDEGSTNTIVPTCLQGPGMTPLDCHCHGTFYLCEILHRGNIFYQ